jgi:Glycosyl hydrolase family 3 N terminal domain./Glycosyl hydrolase family 3 C terminal domain.
MQKTFQKLFTVMLCLVVMVSMAGCGQKNISDSSSRTETTVSSVQPSETPDSADDESQLNLKYDPDATPEEIVASMTLEQKAAQMILPAVYNITNATMKKYDYGSVLSIGYMDITQSGWKKTVLSLQEAALESDSGIPYIYGTDSVHGNQACLGSVIFPHNIGVGAANDKDLAYRMGLAVADEMKLSGIIWSYSPCVAVATEPRWGRTYESYSSDPERVSRLATAYAKGLIDGGVLPCAKHFFGDGNVGYGTGEGDFLIDRGDAKLSDSEIRSLLKVYKDLVDAGVKSIMISHSSLNGVKMHENAHYINDILKGEMGFDGFVVSDWESIHNISVQDPKQQVVTAVNAGIDMLMEPESFSDSYKYLIEAVNEGLISRERIDDAVTRIIRVKKELGILDDPMQKKLSTKQTEVGSDEYREIARQLVEKSLVLLKNDENILPVKRGSKIFVTGPAMNDTGVQCGGWTIQWQGSTDSGSTKFVEGATTILEGLQEIADEYDLTIITDESQALQADMTILCVGEKPYAEWEGDTPDLSLTGSHGLEGNREAIELAKSLGKPTVTLIVAGRNLIIEDYYDDWDAVVMCYLPGSEAGAIANVLTGKVPFTGTLPMPWYKSVDDIGTGNYKFDVGYGLTY